MIESINNVDDRQGTNKNNIALLWLASPIRFSNTISVTNFPECHAPVSASKGPNLMVSMIQWCQSFLIFQWIPAEGWIAGWGSVKSKNHTRRKRGISDELKVAHVKILSFDECKQKVPDLGKHELCAVKGDGKPCVGDEGGPLLIPTTEVNGSKVQIGMLSQTKGDSQTTQIHRKKITLKTL